MNLGFVIFSVSLFSVNQSCTSESSLFSVSFTFVLVMGIEYSIVLNRSVSSANSIHSKTSLAFGRSFRNNKGPRMDPWGTPVVIYCLDDNVL